MKSVILCLVQKLPILPQITPMKRFYFFATLTCLSLFFSLVSFAPTENTTNIVQDVLSQTNQFRKSKGLSGLIMRDELNSIAQKHSADMASGRVGFGHGGFNKRNAQVTKEMNPITSFAENVAYGASTGKAVVDMWKNSTGHRRNMLGRYKYVGIGIAKDKKGRIFYTQIFAG